MLAWTIRVLLIPLFAVLMFWAFSSIALWATGGTPLAGHTAPVVVPSPERPCEAPYAPSPGRPCVAPEAIAADCAGLSPTDIWARPDAWTPIRTYGHACG